MVFPQKQLENSDRSTSDVLKRVSGASIQDNKFAIIRGMSDRYNAAYLNGSPLPSSESDRRAFAFDIFPAGILDNLVILKTATPELPGDFAGGVILITTKNIPEKNSTSVSISGGYNSLTTFKNFKTYKGGKYDALGLDDGTRQLPNTLPSTKEYSEITLNTDKIEEAKKSTTIGVYKIKTVCLILIYNFHRQMYLNYLKKTSEALLPLLTTILIALLFLIEENLKNRALPFKKQEILETQHLLIIYYQVYFGTYLIN